MSSGSRKMSTKSNITRFPSAVPADNLQRSLVIQNPENHKALHLGVVGDTYTVFLSGTDTAGQFCLIKVHVHLEDRLPLHLHYFQETFVLLDGELEATFRAQKGT